MNTKTIKTALISIQMTPKYIFLMAFIVGILLGVALPMFN
jgi:hypothetical protein